MSGGPLEAYLTLKRAGEIREDPRQEVCMKMLDDLAQQVAHYQPRLAGRGSTGATSPPPQSGGFFGGLFGGGKAPAAQAKPQPAKLVPSGPLGLYLWGGTGTGKTFMMDIFHDNVPVQKKKRIHFHEWMIDVHERLHRRQKGSSAATDKSADDLVEQVAEDMLNEAWLLCFDEFQVTHISDAIILKRVFEVLWSRGAVIVATSNRPPEDLYLHGLNRPLFLPFIPVLNDFCKVHPIGDEVDYRLISTKADEDARTFIFPNGPEEQKLLAHKFDKLAQGEVRTGLQLETQGRKIDVPKTAGHSSVAWFTFNGLCDKPLGAADYLAIGSAFHTVFLADIPKLTLQERDQVRRFIVLIDSLYDRHVKVLCTADTDIMNLFYVSDEERKTAVADEIFAWDRTVSRLMEMESDKYLSDVVRSMSGSEFMSQYKLKSITDDDVKDMWQRYDTNDSGDLDMDQLRIFLQDLLEKIKGHRNLNDQAFEACKDVIDTNKDGVVSFEEFHTYLEDYSLIKSTM